MSEEVRDEWDGLETVAIASGGGWFDIIELTLYENRSSFPMRIGLGHTPRKVMKVVFAEATEEDKKKLALKAMEGEEI